MMSMGGLLRGLRGAQDSRTRPRLGRLGRRGVLLCGALLCFGCGGPPRLSLAACQARYGQGPRLTVMPACVDTVRGAMSVEEEYLPGVVDCELGWFTTARPALEAQAIAARTYLGSFLQRHGEDRPVKVTAVFQCWRPAVHARSRHAVAATRDVVMHDNGSILFGNYVAGAKARDEECRALPPPAQGISGFASWADMRAAYDRARQRGARSPFKGVAWTEILATENAGRAGEAVGGSPISRKDPLNRGALGQYAAACLAGKGLETDAILRWFYGEDVRLSRPWSPADAARLRGLADDGVVEPERPGEPQAQGEASLEPRG